VKHAADNIETLSCTCIKLRNCVTCWLEKFVWIWKIDIAKVWLTTCDNSGYFFCLCSFTYVANHLYKFSFSPFAWNILTLVSVTKAVGLRLIENFNFMPCRPTRHYQLAFLPWEHFITVCVCLPSRVLASFPHTHTRPTRSIQSCVIMVRVGLYSSRSLFCISTDL
jgi:hypothetical protein